MPKPRAPALKIDIKDRDIAILRGLFECRIMTSAHVAALYFDGSGEAAKKRLQKLKASGLIGERPRKACDPSVLFLTRQAIDLLQSRGVLAEYPSLARVSMDKRPRVSELTLRHELQVIDVKAAFHAAIGTVRHFSIAEFSTWPLLYQFEAMRPGSNGAPVTVKPDGFVRIHEEEQDGSLSERTFFLEVDRSSETLDTLVARAGCYQDYYRSGGFAVRNGAAPTEFKEYPFRVLMVFKTAERRNNTAERLLQSNPPIRCIAYLSTMEEVMADPLGSIWIRPVDYQEATKDTPFSSERDPRKWAYKRQTEREIHVERTVKRIRLLK